MKRREEFDWLLPEPKQPAERTDYHGGRREEKPVVRPKYRAPKRDVAVKVYTVSQESRYLVIRNIPAIGQGTLDELLKLLSAYGPIEEHRMMDEVDAEPFTDIMWIKFEHISAARVARTKLNRKPFYGHPLQISYSPEYETFEDVKSKLEERKALLLQRTKGRTGNQQNKYESGSSGDRRHEELLPARPGGPRSVIEVTRDAIRHKLQAASSQQVSRTTTSQSETELAGTRQLPATDRKRRRI